MLPEFKELKDHLRKLMLDNIQHLLNNQGILSKIRKKKEFEGDLMEIRYPDGNLKQTEYQEFGSVLEIAESEYKQLIDEGLSFYLKKIIPVLREISQQQRVAFVNTLTQAADSVGNTIDLKGKGLTLESYLSLIERIEFDYNDEGKPDLPTIYLTNPDPKIKKLFEEKVKEHQQTEEFKELIDKKRKEFHDRESNRKLVD